MCVYVCVCVCVCVCVGVGVCVAYMCVVFSKGRMNRFDKKTFKIGL